MNAGSPSPREAGRETAGHALDTVVLDVGGVLLDWDPRHLYRKLIPDPTHMEDFLARICTAEWHAQHDLGAPFTTTIPPLVRAHPEWTAEIEAWGERFPEMWAGPVEGTVEILNELRGDGVPVYAATNWGADNWTTGNDLFDCLHLFDGALVSGQVGIMKPDPR
ncbi:MAG: HAD family hydrolase, partial [Acidimicrobiales bacterium]